MQRPKMALLAAATIAAALAAGVLLGGDARAGTLLVRGWNNVAYLGDTRAPAAALSTIEGQYSAVYRWDAAQQKFALYAPNAPAYVNTLAEIRTGDAVWVNMTADGGSLPSLPASGSSFPSSGRIAVAASSFLPASDLALYQKSFNELAPIGSDDASKRYYAPINLPDGVTVTSMTVAFEASGGDVQVRLDYTPLGNGSATASIYKLVEVVSTAGSSPQTATAFAHTVDNGANVYFLVVDLTGGPGTKLHGVSIAYTG